ncbi:MAG: cation transporter [Chloroflexi bacterium]|nr:cation transporter [Chloroflexota bacterium]
MLDRKHLTRFAWLSIGTAVVTISLKALAYYLTGSVGLLSDALESGVNLVAALMALMALTIAAQPPDDQHAYGHAKAEYFSSGAEGMMILFAAIMIAATAVPRLLDPQPLEQVGLGLVVSVTAGLFNLATALVLTRAGKQHNSITLTADAHHLLSDVWTSVGVVVGVAAVALTGWQILDPLIALAVAAQILNSGVKLVRKSAQGLMDTALPADELALVTAVLDRYCQQESIEYHALRTRQSASQRFVSVHVQVPGEWTVQHGHALLEEMERDLRQALRPLSVITHLEPIEDPASWQDITLNREE